MDSTAEKRPERSIVLVPSSIFKNRQLAVLESLVCYLAETESMSYHEIASLLNRDDRTIWTVYQRTLKKRSQGIDHHKSKNQLKIQSLKAAKPQKQPTNSKKATK